jgi:glycosyltransferase involved in cell wall biosynthesis
MKICQISNLFEPYILGGAEKYVSRIVSQLSQTENIVVVTTDPAIHGIIGKKIHERLTIYRYNPVNIYHTYYAGDQGELIKPVWHGIDLWNPHSYFIIRKILGQEKPDIVHTHNLGGMSLSVFSAIRFLQIPHVHTVHDYSLYCPRATLIHRNGKMCTSPHNACSLYERIKKDLARSPDLVTAPSNYILDDHVKHGFFKNAIVKKVPLGIDLPKKMFCRKPAGTIHILSVGQIVRHKGVAVLINAFRLIESDHAVLHIVGKGPDFNECQRLASGDKRILFHGFVSAEQLDQLYRTAHLLVIPSLWPDNSPMVIYEAFSYGLPVIGSRIGGIPELIDHGKNGFLTEPGNVSGLAAAMNELIMDPLRMQMMSECARDSAEPFGIERHCDLLQRIYTELLATNEKKPQ